MLQSHVFESNHSQLSSSAAAITHQCEAQQRFVEVVPIPGGKCLFLGCSVNYIRRRSCPAEAE